MEVIDKQEIRINILKKIDIIKREIDILKDITKPISPDSAIGRITRMDAINNKSVNESSLKLKIQKQKNLQNALINIDKDNFGVCIICKNKIPLGRIIIMPESVKCVNCASQK